MVLEGGGLRGLYTAGVLDVLLENKVKVDGIIGVSAGALFGVNYVSGQKGRALRYNKEYCNDKRYMSIRSFLTTGNYINKDFAFYKMSKELDQFDNLAFLNSKTSFYATVTNVKTGEAEYMQVKNPIEEMEVLRATSAIPLISRMVKLDNQEKYLDGGISDSVPVDQCISLGYNKIIVVETQPINYRKKPFKKSRKILLKMRYLRYPKLVKAIINRYARYNIIKKEIIDLEKEGEIFVIRPSRKITININNKDKKYYQEIYDLGVKDAENAIKNLKKYLTSKEMYVKID